ncbi:UNVERIFIED_CONTAM: hypothetical protein NCL1_10318 [Trichonephila clavipes]
MEAIKDVIRVTRFDDKVALGEINNVNLTENRMLHELNPAHITNTSYDAPPNEFLEKDRMRFSTCSNAKIY